MEQGAIILLQPLVSVMRKGNQVKFDFYSYKVLYNTLLQSSETTIKPSIIILLDQSTVLSESSLIHSYSVIAFILV